MTMVINSGSRARFFKRKLTPKAFGVHSNGAVHMQAWFFLNFEGGSDFAQRARRRNNGKAEMKREENAQRPMGEVGDWGSIMIRIRSMSRMKR